MAARGPRVGIVGTFDVENYGDLLFPLIARHELAARVPELELVPFSYHARASGSWPYEVRALVELGDAIGDLDLMLVGGGHLIRFDKTVAYGYQPPTPDLHHPTAYGLMPTLLAGWTATPVAWNAVGVSTETPAWAEPLLAEAARAAHYLSVRDQPSADEVRRLAPDVDVRVVPDTAFGVAAVVDGSSREVLELREELGVTDRSYVVYQPSPDLAPFRTWLARTLRWYARHDLTIVELPVSPCLGDHVGVVEVETPTVSPVRWPSPLALAGLVAGAEAAVARSLHLSITAITAGVPVVRRTSDLGTKYRVLDDLQGVHVVGDADAEDSLPLGRSEPAPDVAAHVAALRRHWDSIAGLLDERPRVRARSLVTAIGRLTELSESAAQEGVRVARLARERAEAVAELEVERSRGSLVDRMLAERDERLHELDRKLRDTSGELEQVTSSKSWALTRPLRAARSRVDRRQASAAQPGVQPATGEVARSAGPGSEPDPEAYQNSAGVRPSQVEPPQADESERDARSVGDDAGSLAPVPLLEDVVDVPTSPVRKVAFYLPQFHPIPENDAWWGRGFTEWTNVTRAKPLFEGHVQPQRPGELGYYDLRVVETQRRQVELAHSYGIDAFCFHFYWFAGKRLLERPIRQYLDDPTLDLPFCLCWANESWSRRWDGRADDILIEQQHSDADDLAFIEYVTQYFDDPRYVRVNGRPLLVVYRPGVLPDARATVARWRDRYRSMRGEELLVAHTTAFDDDSPETYGCDAAIEFPPVRLGASNPRVPPRLGEDAIASLTDERPHVFDGRFFVEESRRYSVPDHLLFRGVCPGWDNTARAGKDAYILWGTSPVGFQTWVRNALVETEERLSGDERLVFVNAWNEWAEGCHLEPDERHGYAHLEALRVASVRAAVRPRPAVATDPPRVAAVVDVDDSSALGDYLGGIGSLDEECGLVVTTRPHDRARVEAELERHSRTSHLFEVDGPGDPLPFLDVLALLGASHGAAYDVLLKLPAPAALQRSGTQDAFDDLLDEAVVREVLRAFEEQPELGLVGPAVDRAALGDLGASDGAVEALAHRLGVADVNAARDSYFPTGLYFVRPAALAPMLAIALDRADPDTQHALEASLGLSIVAAGFRIEDTRSFRRVAGALPSSSG